GEELAQLAFPEAVDAPAPQPLPVSRSGRPVASTTPSQASRVLPWHSSSRHPVEPSSRTATHGALALLEQPQVYPDTRPATAQRTILLAEDDFRLASAMRSALELEGESEWNVTVAGTGSRTLELAMAHPPHVILLDLYLPDVDGSEVYRRLRSHPTTR